MFTGASARGIWYGLLRKKGTQGSFLRIITTNVERVINIPSGRSERIKRIDPRYLAIGTKIEMEHTKDRSTARKIATDHLLEHKTYYQVLPAAEQFMGILENKKPPAKKKRRVPAGPQMPQGFYGYGR